MPDQNVIQEPANLQELLYVKSLPALNRMLGPVINGTAAKNFRILDVKIVNAQTVVVVEQTTDVTLDIATATAEQKVVREIPYNRYSIADVFHHYLGSGEHGGAVPGNEAELKTWLADRTDKLEIDNTLYVEYGDKYVSIRPKDLKDLKWHGVVFLNFPMPLSGENPDSGSPINAEDNITIAKVSLTANLAGVFDGIVDVNDRVYLGIDSDVTERKRLVVGVKVGSEIQLKQTFTIVPGQRLIAPITVSNVGNVTSLSFVVISTDDEDDTIYADESVNYNPVLPTSLVITDFNGDELGETFAARSAGEELDLSTNFVGVDGNYLPHAITWSVTGYNGVTIAAVGPGRDAKLKVNVGPVVERDIVITARMGTKLVGTFNLTLVIPSAEVADISVVRTTSDIAGLNEVTGVSNGDPLYIAISNNVTVPKLFQVVKKINDTEGPAINGTMMPGVESIVPVETTDLGEITEFEILVVSPNTGAQLAGTAVQYDRFDPVTSVEITGIPDAVTWMSTTQSYDLTALTNNGPSYVPQSSDWSATGYDHISLTKNGTTAVFKLTQLPTENVDITITATVNGVVGTFVTHIGPAAETFFGLNSAT